MTGALFINAYKVFNSISRGVLIGTSTAGIKVNAAFCPWTFI